MTEEWRVVDGWESYEVSDAGRVRRSGRVLKTIVTVYGYGVVSMVDGGSRRRRANVHRLVLEAFVGPCPDGMECRHLNGRRLDNRLVNLRWGTRQENHADKQRHGTVVHGVRFWSSKLDDVEVAAMRIGRAAGMTYTALGRLFFVSKVAARNACLGKTWKRVKVSEAV